MTELQKVYKTDEQVDFEDKLLKDEDLFFFYARLYMNAHDEDRESFLSWCWEKTRGL